MSRFVVLTHDFPHWHWDLMLEDAGALRTWRLSRAPDDPQPPLAERLADHRLHYLDYEGPVSGNRGVVARWDQGEYTVENERPGQLRIRFAGGRLNGIAELSTEASTGELTFRWLSE